MTRGALFDVDDTLVDHGVFHHACALLDTAAGETAYVGDRLDHDAIGARVAGPRAVWLDRADGPVEVPDGVVRGTSLSGLEAVLR